MPPTSAVPTIPGTTYLLSSKTDYSKYVVPGIVGTALVGGTAVTYGIIKNKDNKKEKNEDENDADISLSDF